MEEDLPQDPSDNYYLTNCYACKAIAKLDQEYIRNYGGIVCLSCRAFFRRAYQNQSVSIFTCKADGKCTITRENRRKCPKCRLERCLQAGMSHTAILTPEQKKTRFRKMLKKYEQQQQQLQQLDQHHPRPEQHQAQQKRQRKRLPQNSEFSSAMDTESDIQVLVTGTVYVYIYICVCVCVCVCVLNYNTVQ
jgi:hypothetical protein